MSTLPYLCSAYTIIAVILSAYTVRLAWRLRALKQQADNVDQEGGVR